MKYGLLGAQLAHSYSKIIHEKLGLYPYDLFPTPPEKLDEFLGKREFSGLNVTIPYKTSVAKYCDVIDSEAAEIGAINTLYFQNGSLHGANTDYFGLKYGTDLAGISFARKKVLLLGGGGTSRTACALIQQEGAKELTVAQRHPQHGTNTSDSIHATYVSYDNLPYDAEIIVNTTPVGMYPDNLKTLLHLKDFPKCQGVVDVIYNPFLTVLVQEAMDLGLPHTGGLPMLVAQGIRSAELFTGEKDLTQQIPSILGELQHSLQNIVLIGMPGSGKSVLGKLLAKKTNRPFIDLDKKIIQVAGKSIPEIFREDGEKKFRELETKVTLETGKQNSQVIATGGGILMQPINIQALRQNGILVYLDRPISQLATKGRPLSTTPSALEELYLARRPLYEKYQDLTVINQGSIPQVLETLIELLK
jgi:shikimate dehydrogenase